MAAVPERTNARSDAANDVLGWRRWIRPALFTALALIVVSTPWIAPPLLANLEYFKLRRIEFEGVQYARVAELREAAGVDRSWSIWDDLDTVAVSVEQMPMVATASVERRFPSSIVVRITERVPVAFVTRKGVLVAVDAEGRDLPIDLTRTPIDLPIALSADSAVFRVLDDLRQMAPPIFNRISSARRVSRDHLLFDLDQFVVRTRDDVTVGRFRDILPVEADLARNRLRAVELDLRFQDQVIVRQP